MEISRPLLLLITLTALAMPVAAQERLTLERAVELALTRNERSAMADARVEAAEARVRRARSFFFPELSINGAYTRRAYETTRQIDGETVVIQDFNALNGNVTISSAVFDARAFPLYRSAKLSREAVRYTAVNDKRLLAFESADAFLTTLGIERLLDATERRRELARAIMDDARARFEAGLVSSNDVTRAELEFATAEREVIRSRGNLESAYLNLSNLIDAPVGTPLVPPAEFLAQADAPEAAQGFSVERAQASRPDLFAALRSAESLREFAKEPSMRIIPTLNFVGQYRATNEGGLSGRDEDGSAALLLGWQVFDGGERSAEKAERLAAARVAELDAHALGREIELDVRRAQVSITSDQASVKQAVTAVQVARRNATETQELYRQGLASALEVNDANFRLFEAEVEELRARYQLALAYLDLRAASGYTPLGQENPS